jgi:hypothetical protein
VASSAIASVLESVPRIGLGNVPRGVLGSVLRVFQQPYTPKSLGKAETARQVNNNDSSWKTDCGNRFLTSN